jgi:hypothetical protein
MRLCISRLIALGILLYDPSALDAQQIASTSHGTINIRVSVAPRFRVEALPTGVTVSSANGKHTIRYKVVESSLRSADRTRVIIIVPD